MTRPAYPSYKPSGVEWLGDVPEHWAVERLKTRADAWVSPVNKVPSEDEEPVRLLNYTDVYYHDRVTPEMDLMETTATVSEIERFGLRIDDVVITKDSEDWSDIAVPTLVAATSDDFVCGYHLAIIRPRGDELVGPFLHRALQSRAINQHFQLSASGVTRYGIPKSSIGETPLPLPPPEEQRSIAAFLDRETAKVDRLIGKKRELIERLAEKRQALISRTVTRGLPPDAARAAGLDPHPPMKDSGIDWLGEVPEHWETRRLRHIGADVTVGVVVNPSSYVTDVGVPFLLGGDIREFEVDADNAKRCLREVSAGTLGKSCLRTGDLVVVRVGYPGVAAVIGPELDGANCASMMLVRGHPRFHSQWLAYAFNSQSGRDQIEIVQYGAAQKQFNISHAVDFTFAFPPLDEQVAIAEFLDAERERIRAMTTKVEEAIDRLREFRTALITAAVTGKIDVRETAGATTP